MPSPLTHAQLQHFDEQGYLIVEELFTDAELQPVIDEVNDEVNRRALDLVAAGKLPCSYEEFGFERQLTKISSHTDSVALSIWNGALAGPAIFNLIRNDKLLDIAEQVCGPELIASSVYRLRPKIPGHNMGPVPWHQDSGYLEPYCDKTMVLTVWLPLVDANAENGCMWVIPGVHKGEVFTHAGRKNLPYLEIPKQHLPGVKPVCAPVKKRGVLLLTNRAPHASFENKTERVRWSMDLRYQNAALPTNALITRLEGDSVPSAEAGVPRACYPPEADFLIRSRLRPNEVVTDPARFHQIRTQHLSLPVSPRW